MVQKKAYTLISQLCSYKSTAQLCSYFGRQAEREFIIFELTNVTVGALPTGYAHFSALVSACEMTKLIVAWPTESRTRGVIIVG